MAARRRSSPKIPAGRSRREFVSEAEEHIDSVRAGLEALQEGRFDPRGKADPEILNRIFRSAHSLKGLAGLFGHEVIESLAHHLEDVLDGLRLGRIPLGAQPLGLLDDAVGLFQDLLRALGDAGREEELAQAVTRLARRIEPLASAPAAEESDFSELDLAPTLLGALTEYEEHRLRENLDLDRHICMIDTQFEIIAFEEGLSEISAAVREVGEVISTLPSPAETPEYQIRFSLLVGVDIPSQELAGRLRASNTVVRALRPATGGTMAPQTRPEPRSPSASAAADPSETARGPQHTQHVESESLRSIGESVRIDIGKLDDLLVVAAELAAKRSAIGRIAERLCADAATRPIGSELAQLHAALERKSESLQAGVLEMRMVPVSQVFERLTRVVRRLCRELGKEVELELSGGETELDKRIIEELGDPLLHVVRNALDHGIEPVDRRVAEGKPARGCIRVAATQRGNQVVIEVSDDGRGVDLAGVRGRAEALGLIGPDAVLAKREILALLTASGFSTRDEVSSTSGRGVGLDVVRSNVTDLGGCVDIDSQPGRGTTVCITLPITLAIVRSLIVRAAGQHYAIPLHAFRETLRVPPAEIQHSEQRELLNLRGEALPLRWLSRALGLPADAPRGDPYVVVLRVGERRLGLLVDHLEGQEDTVIKRIQGPFRAAHGVAGAAEHSEHGAILVLDAASLLEASAPREVAA